MRARALSHKRQACVRVCIVPEGLLYCAPVVVWCGGGALKMYARPGGQARGCGPSDALPENAVFDTETDI